jgi:hypothetical protein
MTRYTFISINASTPERGMELLAIDTVESELPHRLAVRANFEWLKDIGDEPSGELVQHADGYWHFENDAFLRIYVQVG